MEIRFITQPALTFAEEIKKNLAQYEVISIATAYLSKDGIKEFENDFLNRNVRILCGIHGCISDLPALRELVSQSDQCVEGHVFLGANVFHPKIYIFVNKDQVKVIIGSANLTGSGLSKNEEACVEIAGTHLDQPISDVINYFNSLWKTNSISVEQFLLENPGYTVQTNRNVHLATDHISTLEALKVKLVSDYIISFINPVNLTFLNKGKQTLPTRFNRKLNSLKLCSLNESVNFSIYLPDASLVRGKIYRGYNYRTEYYQLSLNNYGYALRRLISLNEELEYQIDLEKKVVRITKK